MPLFGRSFGPVWVNSTNLSTPFPCQSILIIKGKPAFRPEQRFLPWREKLASLIFFGCGQISRLSPGFDRTFPLTNGMMETVLTEWR
jgi:hypothetical protein